MNKLLIYPIAVLLFWSVRTYAQFNVRFNVVSGTSTTTCTDPIGTPEPQWAVNIDNQGWVVYPSNVICYTNFPNEQYNETFTCFADIPATIPVCFRAFENDASLLDPCTPVFSCQTELCINVPIPPMGTVPFSIALPPGGQSAGSVNMEIAVSGVPNSINDLICNAAPLGTLQTAIPVGYADTSVFNNICATNLNEPNPIINNGPWFNNQGVWFTFTTGPGPLGPIRIDALSDPSNFGDPVNLQLAIYSSSTNDCSGNFSFIYQNHEAISWDEHLLFNCPQPNTTYFILVDGVQSTQEEIEGWFSLELEQLDVLYASEFRCGAENIGSVPLGGTISTDLRSNSCSNNTNMMPATAFGVQKSVWFTFTPPPTGHVNIQGISSSIDPIGLQLAIYESSNGTCTGTLTEVYSQTTGADLDENMEVHCLDPNTTYFLLVDGALSELNTGIFSLSISDAGNETPTTTLNPVVCFGETFSAAGNIYNQTGVYNDTLQLPGGCDSIVVTNLTVLPELQVSLQIVNQGVGQGNTAGQVQANPTGGTGNYTYLWSNGQTTNLATGLVGGDNYCVTITDTNNCQSDTCFDMPYYIHFIPSATGSSVACHGDLTGTLEFTALGGVPPYQFEWQNLQNNDSGAGFIPIDGQVIALSGLPGGQYAIRLYDIVFDTTVLVDILEPTALQAAASNITNATCNNLCDGSMTVNVTGGISPYQIDWENGFTGTTATSLCAGSYQVTITDANGCTLDFEENVTEPAPFTALASELQAVSCFQGNDGRAQVTTSENATYIWSNGATTSTITNLPGGSYSVTATNAAGCTATASILVSTPASPVTALISISQGIICQGDNSGELQAQASGPGNTFTYFWSNGGNGNSITNLEAGNYSVTITNELGCSTSSIATLTEPQAIQVSATTNEITCLDPVDAGIISIETVSGGQAPYEFSSDGVNFGPDSNLVGFLAGINTFFVLDAGGCVREFESSIQGPSELLVELGNNIVLDLGDSLVLEAETSQADLSYAWSPSQGLSCTDCPAPIAAPYVSTEYVLVVTNADGCTATDDIGIVVTNNQNVYIPNAFSPNDDGINDEFMPYTGGSVRRIRSLRVFDRQGNHVYDGKNLVPNQVGMGWDGRFRGKDMQSAVFGWMAEIEYVDGKVQLLKGDVVLVR